MESTSEYVVTLNRDSPNCDLSPKGKKVRYTGNDVSSDDQ